eukprot:245216-Pelagomonas_calceolata.AAC.17
MQALICWGVQRSWLPGRGELGNRWPGWLLRRGVPGWLPGGGELSKHGLQGRGGAVWGRGALELVHWGWVGGQQSSGEMRRGVRGGVADLCAHAATAERFGMEV